MSGTRSPGRTERRRIATLVSVIAVQLGCAVFFLGDVIADLWTGDDSEGPHSYIESIAAVALLFGAITLIFELRRILRRMATLRRGIDAARGEMAHVINGFFDRWQLTPSEREVGLLILKGFDNDTIGQIRGTAPGTVRAQSAQIYAKAGVDGRAQLFSVFMEELLAAETSQPA